MIAPTVGLESQPTSPISSTTGRSPVSMKRMSLSSARSLSSESLVDMLHPSKKALSRSSSASSLGFFDGEVEVVTEEGVGHVTARLEAKSYKSSAFAESLLNLVLCLHIPSWSSLPAGTLSSQYLKVQKVSGSLTNAVFFVSYPILPAVKTLLLRIYGASSSSLISRPRELHTLHILSSQYRIGPRVYGTFDNGRVEEYFDSEALTAADLRDPTISGWIGARMAELHRVDIEAVEQTTPVTRGEDVGWEIAARKNVRSWLQPAQDVLALPGVKAETNKALDLPRFVKEWERYSQWLREWEKAHGASKRVFAHNDAQYGNLLKMSQKKEGAPAHRQIIVVDFEYASPNSAAFDIANHFHEWTANYHGAQPHVLLPERYPNETERRNFYRSYVTHASSGDDPVDVDAEMQKLEAQVKAWSPASHAMWAIWGIVQAREDMEALQNNGGVVEQPEFNYLGYAQCRLDGFRREIKTLGV